MISLLAIALRLLLLPIGHPWDLTVDYNVFIDLIHNHSPYDTFTTLSNMAIAGHWDHVYEYYAYPPVPLYMYYPLAKIYGILHPHAQYFIALPGSYAVPSLGLDFFFLFKLPIWIADFLIATLLARMAGTIRGYRDYLLNPFVLLVSGAWTFDAIMLLGLIAAVYAIYRSKFIWAGIALAFGTMVKFFPIIALPAIVIYLIKKNRPLREIFFFVGSYVIACGVMLGPFANGVLNVLTFHSSRPGGGMNWQDIWTSGALFGDPSTLLPILLAIGAFGTPILIITFMLACLYMWKVEMSLNRMIIVSVLAFFVGSKLINEQYAMLIIPFAWLEAHRVKGAWAWFYRLFWIIPIAFVTFHGPIDHFLWLLYYMVFKSRADITVLTGMTGFEWTMIPWKHAPYAQAISVFLGFVFSILSLVALLWPVARSTERWKGLQRLRLKIEADRLPS
ncbi:hypothetical protein KTT_02990 [Tengunoibacter tsumagoiensis]|uniref:DUF2029 domain-containing protein n=2 Tax=Tengunoibacter tsumagoiensis TaxID=2014871 RepID=A0A401ZUN2_9CHLR|nr:hypothetical protein KTT_02990 [Tengunoibacter tsumagoiensis]